MASFPACKVVEGCPVPIVIFCGEKSEILTRVFADVHENWTVTQALAHVGA